MIGALERPTKTDLSFESADGTMKLSFVRVEPRRFSLAGNGSISLLTTQTLSGVGLAG